MGKHWLVIALTSFCTGELAGGCQLDEGRPPVARIRLDPPRVREHDDFRTDITLDGSESDDPLDDPTRSESLMMHWEIVGDESRFEQGDANSIAPVIRVRATTPATIRLTVTDADGLTNTAESQLQLTLD